MLKKRTDACLISRKVRLSHRSWIGDRAALAIELNQLGCNIWLTDINETSLNETVLSLTNTAANHNTRVVDSGSPSAIETLASEVNSDIGYLDIIINNAGVGLGATFEEMAMEDFEWLMDINFWGVVYGCKAFLPLVKQAATGHIVNISSVFGLVSLPTVSAYNASKFAVRGFTESLRQELEGTSVHVCCVHPGGIDTNIALNSRGTINDMSRKEKAEKFKKVAKTSPEHAARKITKAIQTRKTLVDRLDAHFISALSRLFPVNYSRVLARLIPEAEEIKKTLNSP